MKISRRSFLWVSGAAITGSLATQLGCTTQKDVVKFGADAKDLRINYAQTSTTICPFCGVGCGILCYVENGELVGTEGDPDNPINEGSLCSKGSSVFNMAYIYDDSGRKIPNPSRVTQVLYRAPYASDWEVKDWDWALETIAQRIKQTRDETFERVDSNGVTVNRTTALAWLGSAMCNNEENYLFHKLAKALGIINIDHCARL
jgi:formate dehydrogenase major subunit